MRSCRPIVVTLVTLWMLTTPALPALANTPGTNNSTFPEVLNAIGSNGGGTADPLGAYEVVVRDLANNPIANSYVTLDFTSCSDLRLCSDALDPDAIVSCANRTVSKVTDANGRATFRILGYSPVAPTTPGPTSTSLRVYADGVLLGFARVAIYDLTGGAGTAPSDLAAWLDEFFYGAAVSRADYDGNGILGPSDLSKWLGLFFASGSIANCAAASCP